MFWFVNGINGTMKPADGFMFLLWSGNTRAITPSLSKLFLSMKFSNEVDETSGSLKNVRFSSLATIMDGIKTRIVIMAKIKREIKWKSDMVNLCEFKGDDRLRLLHLLKYHSHMSSMDFLYRS